MKKFIAQVSSSLDDDSGHTFGGLMLIQADEFNFKTKQASSAVACRLQSDARRDCFGLRVTPFFLARAQTVQQIGNETALRSLCSALEEPYDEMFFRRFSAVKSLAEGCVCVCVRDDDRCRAFFFTARTLRLRMRQKLRRRLRKLLGRREWCVRRLVGSLAPRRLTRGAGASISVHETDSRGRRQLAARCARVCVSRFAFDRLLGSLLCLCLCVCVRLLNFVCGL